MFCFSFHFLDNAGPPVTSTPVKSVPDSIESPNLTVESISDTRSVEMFKRFRVNATYIHSMCNV